MREYSFILPLNDNHGKSLAQLHLDAKRDLCMQFGGYSAVAQSGGWINDDGEFMLDESVRYTVAIDDIHGFDVCKFEEIATFYAMKARQLALYVVHDGEVTIKELPVFCDNDLNTRLMERHNANSAW